MTLQSSEASATAATPLGDVSLNVAGSPGVTIVVTEAKVPALPAGMTVDGVILMSIRVATPVAPGSPLRIEVAVGRDGDSETGEWLESMAFTSREGILHVATHDSEWLAGKGIAADYVRYGRQGFTQTIGQAPAGTALSVTIAWRVDDDASAADDNATWFAADLALPS